MALKFYCEHCGQQIIIRFLPIGEKTECPICKASITVPKHAQHTDQEPITNNNYSTCRQFPVNNMSKFKLNWISFFIGIGIGIGVIVCTVLFLTLSNRYEVTSNSIMNSSVPIKLDKWTGKTWHIRMGDNGFVWKEMQSLK